VLRSQAINDVKMKMEEAVSTGIDSELRELNFG
jgi:hypothetical protein